jgi:hypothetical protein
MSGGARAVAAATAAVFVAGSRKGSAVLVDERHLLTAGHVLRSTVDGRSVLAEQVEVQFPSGPAPDARLPAARVELAPDVTADVAVFDLGPKPAVAVPRPVSLWPAGGSRSGSACWAFPRPRGS